MTDLTRPNLLGYLSIKDRPTTPAVENRMRQQLIAFAESEGYSLKSIFTDTLDTGTVRINDLVEQISKADPVPAVAMLKGAEMTKGYATLLADAGVVVLTVPSSNEDAEVDDILRPASAKSN